MNNNTKFDFNDILLTPAVSSKISSRSDINPYDHTGFLPIITAPMDTVVDKDNYLNFTVNKVNVCFPRNTPYIGVRNDCMRIFYSFSLSEFKSCFFNRNIETQDGETCYVLIDVANGHIAELVEMVTQAKKRFGDNMFLMVGNVANPETFIKLAKAGADAVRVGIGNGNGCLTTQQTGIGFPMASLISECYKQREVYYYKTFIVADGGMKDYSDIIKALALGADYVMVGSIFNKALESCGETKLFNYFKVEPQGKIAKFALEHHLPLSKRFRGMSTKEVQKLWNVATLKTSEGIVQTRPVQYTLRQWVNNFESYLRSAMSYCNSPTLKDFKNIEFNFITENSFKRFNK
jgi:IMP dehydrogenase/GMP reductase